MRFEAVIFDWGGTLTPPLEANPDYLHETWEDAARVLNPDEYEAVVKHLAAANEEVWDRVRRGTVSSRLHEVIETVVAELELEVAESVLEEAAQHHLNAWSPLIEHEPDAIPVLESLRAKGYKLGLLSNTMWPRSFHDDLLTRDGLIDLFDARLYSSELEYTKPHADVFRAVMEAVGVSDPGRAVFVGDRPFDDIHGSKQAGMVAILRPNPAVPPFDDAEPDATIEQLTELPKVLEELEAR
jgi:putative hydrolase of the HAD superfamily